MTLQEAIEILSNSANAGVTTFDEKFKQAERLVIEALIREQGHRINQKPTQIRLLPGETEE